MSVRLSPPQFVGRRVAPGNTVSGEFTYSIVDIAAEALWAGQERRGARRLRTRLRDGIIGKTKHRSIAQCTIKDRSGGGARLQLDVAHALPPSFVLSDSAARMLYRATLVWQDGREAGVQLVEVE